MTFCISKLNKQFDLFQPANQWTSERITTSNFRGVYSKWERIKQSLYIRLVYIYFSFAWANVNIKFNAMDATEHMIHENHDYTLKYGYLQLPLRKKAFQTIIEWKLYRIYVARFLPIELFACSSAILLFLKHFTRKWSFHFHSLNFMPTKCY